MSIKEVTFGKPEVTRWQTAFEIRAETRFLLSAKRASSVDYWQPRCAHQR